MRRAFAILAAGVLAACGELESPDLETGNVSGVFRNASAAAYVYPFGRPDLVVRPGPDGRYTLVDVPEETDALVFVDGAPGSWRAALVQVEVEGGEDRRAPDVDSLALPPAGRVAAIAQLGGACVSQPTRFTVLGTDQIDVTAAAAGTAALLDRLPAGVFQLAARLDGFTDGLGSVTVAPGATAPYELALDVGSGDAPGCRAPGVTCRTPLHCSPDDGVCYECLEDSHCIGAGAESACRNRSCVDLSAKAELCGPCAQDGDCQSGTCAPGAFCSRRCAAGCPAGFACDLASDVCLPRESCGEVREEMGADCFTDQACQDHLAGGTCWGALPGANPPKPGYCTGTCSVSGDCSLVAGYVCASGVCRHP